MNFFKSYIRDLLSNFKWYRKRKGGTWYYVYDSRSDFGLAGDTTCWTQEPGEMTVIKVDKY